MRRTKAMVPTMVVEVAPAKDTVPDKGMATGPVRVGAAVAAVANDSLEAFAMPSGNRLEKTHPAT